MKEPCNILMEKIERLAVALNHRPRKKKTQTRTSIKGKNNCPAFPASSVTNLVVLRYLLAEEEQDTHRKTYYSRSHSQGQTSSEGRPSSSSSLPSNSSVLVRYIEKKELQGTPFYS
jgi:hypothetical protein